MLLDKTINDNSPVVLVWFRNNLRIGDNPSLDVASKSNSKIVPFFVWPGDSKYDTPVPNRTLWWLKESLQVLNSQLEKIDSRLIIRTGSSIESITNLIKDTGAKSVYCDYGYETHQREIDYELSLYLRKNLGVEMHFTRSNLLFDPSLVLNGNGRPYSVFSAFRKKCMSMADIDNPVPAPNRLLSPKIWPDSEQISDVRILSNSPVPNMLSKYWEPGEVTAKSYLKRFIDSDIGDYQSKRDLFSDNRTSKLSPFIRHGEISLRQIWHAVGNSADVSRNDVGGYSFLRQLLWREFAYHTMIHFPKSTTSSVKREFDLFPWNIDEESLISWKFGKTGFPIVDAGMRELIETGWINNRIRMIVSSFLVKNLLISWQQGAAWFKELLVDGDDANNSLGWQWVSGCGVDQNPYFRIFNPITQSKKFDAEGTYIKKWIPELQSLSKLWIHEPSKAPRNELSKCGVKLGESYPLPIIDHKYARDRALTAYTDFRKSLGKN